MPYATHTGVLKKRLIALHLTRFEDAHRGAAKLLTASAALTTVPPIVTSSTTWQTQAAGDDDAPWISLVPAVAVAARRRRSADAKRPARGADHSSLCWPYVWAPAGPCGRTGDTALGLYRRSSLATRRRDAITVRSRSPHRPPASPSVPRLPVRHRTAGRSTRSDTLVVGATPSTRAKLRRAGHYLLRSRQSAAAFRSGLASPRHRSRPIRA